MLAYDFSVYDLHPMHVSHIKRNKYLLASWEASFSGAHWLDVLIGEGKAAQLRNDGFPNIYQSTAGIVLPLLMQEQIRPRRELPSDQVEQSEFRYSQPYGWMHKIKLFPEAIAACIESSTVTIVAWDQS